MKIYTTLIALLVCSLLSAQSPREDRQNRIKALKIAFITEQLNLTTQEAQNFWPIYNAFETKMVQERKAEFKVLRNKKIDINELSDAQSQEVITTILTIEQNRLANKKQLITDLKGIVSPKKALKLLKSEEEFKRKLIKELRGRHAKGGRSRGRP